jgi:hypothetical protein
VSLPYFLLASARPVLEAGDWDLAGLGASLHDDGESAAEFLGLIMTLIRLGSAGGADRPAADWGGCRVVVVVVFDRTDCVRLDIGAACLAAPATRDKDDVERDDTLALCFISS